MSEFWDYIKNRLFNSSLNIVLGVFVLFSSILLIRLFVLQVFRGQKYLDNYNLLVEKKDTIEATRGNIYDRNGNLLAYNEVANSVTIEDKFSDYSKDQRNKELNNVICKVITHIEANGDTLTNNFNVVMNSNGKYEYNIEGTKLQRFRADVFGKKTISELTYDSKLGLNLSTVSAQEMMNYLYSEKAYNISKKYPEDMRYKICVVRYALGLNSYQKYISTIIASNVSDKTVAYVKENETDLPGIAIEDKSERKYVDSQYFASILGYTGQISDDEYIKLKKKNKNVNSNDVVGKSGIEKVMNNYLSGTKGSDTIYVDSTGNVIKKTKHKDAVSGNDVYLSIDKDLQVRAYNLLESKLAGIISAYLVNAKTVDLTADEIQIPVYDVYVNLIQNKVVNYNHFTKNGATDLEMSVQKKYEKYSKDVYSEIESKLKAKDGTNFSSETEEYQDYESKILSILKNNNVLLKNKIDTSDDTYKKWAAGSISLNEYLRHCIEKDWIEVSALNSTTKYADSDELYNTLISYIITNIKSDTNFVNAIYEYAIRNDVISGNEVCALLYDQGVLKADENTRNGLVSGKVNAYNFLQQKIQSIEITPGQLGVDPSTASCVIMNPKTGEILACVSYPGYDNNRLANQVDTNYYSYLISSKSSPLYNHATQQRTAPGSTYKISTSVAGLKEGVINTSTVFGCSGQFDLISNKPKCWIYPGGHGSENVTSAIKDSCNVFFYNVGYNLAGGPDNYNDALGIKRLNKYASMFGLDRKTGVEIDENPSQLATQYPVMAAIGQSDNNMTTIGLCRYASAISTRGNVYDLTLLDHVQSKSGEKLKSYSPKLTNQVNIVSTDQWNAIQTGMEQVVENTSTYQGFSIKVAGKTGTAQESKKRPSHSLFIGYAPSDNPEMAFAIRIPHGHGSANAVAVSKDIVGCFFGDQASIDKANTLQAHESSTAVGD